MTMQGGGDDAAVVWELLRVASAMRSELVERDVFRERLVDGVKHPVGFTGSAATESHGGPSSPITVTTSTASRSAGFCPVC
jgi:hypothetical protein